jgi:hypothetical protein
VILDGMDVQGGAGGACTVIPSMSFMTSSYIQEKWCCGRRKSRLDVRRAAKVWWKEAVSCGVLLMHAQHLANQ